MYTMYGKSYYIIYTKYTCEFFAVEIFLMRTTLFRRVENVLRKYFEKLIISVRIMFYYSLLGYDWLSTTYPCEYATLRYLPEVYAHHTFFSRSPLQKVIIISNTCKYVQMCNQIVIINRNIYLYT